MQKPTHYMEVRALPLDGASPSGGDIAFVMSKVMGCVHLHIVEGNQIAVSFPGMRTEVIKDDLGKVIEGVGIGSRIRLFGTMENLMAFLARQDFAQLVGGAACSVGKVPVKEIPATETWEVLSRDRSAERGTEAFVARTDRRLRDRIREGRSQISLESADKRLEKLKPASKRTPPYVFVDSASTGKRFRLFLRRRDAEGGFSGNLNSYGLGVSVPSF